MLSLEVVSGVFDGGASPGKFAKKLYGLYTKE
jgi:hypothetical protein